ncbi:hypothetical protein Dimus_031066 [Dionaea muscipula]
MASCKALLSHMSYMSCMGCMGYTLFMHPLPAWAYITAHMMTMLSASRRNGAVGGTACSWRSCTKAKLAAVMEKLTSVAVFVGVAHCLEKSKLSLAVPGEGWPRGGGRCSPRKVSLLARGREKVQSLALCGIQAQRLQIGPRRWNPSIATCKLLQVSS